MIFVDTSVWIDFFNDVDLPHVERLEQAIRGKSVITGDLVVAELLQGFRDERSAAAAQADLSAFRVVEVAGVDTAIRAAANYRLLQTRGISIRSTIDTLIATRCIIENWPLLHRDRDYDPFVAHLGLVPALRVN